MNTREAAQDMQSIANRYAARYNLGNVEVQVVPAWLVSKCGFYAGGAIRVVDGDTNAVRHHLAHMANKEGNLHGHEWRKVAVKFGAEPKAFVGQGGKNPRVANRKVFRAPVARMHVNAVRFAPVAPVAQIPAYVENPTTREEWIAFISAKSLKQLGQGASRTTYALDDNRVIKIERFAHFREQCASEVECWNRADADKRECLATIYDSGNGWVIMERAKSTLSAFDRNTAATISNDLHAATRIGDLHAANIGYFGKGRFKIIDYAL